MKKMLLSIILLFGIIFAENWITIKYCNLRETPNPKGEKIKIVKAGEKIKIVNIYGDYKKVKVLSGDHTGKIGYMWTKLVKKTDDGYICDKKGCSLREKPTRKSKRLANVGGGRKLKIIETVVTWYKIQLNDNSEGWVYKTSIKDIDNLEESK